jgi:hypothetical protein
VLKIIAIWLNTLLLLFTISSPAAAPFSHPELNNEQEQIVNDVIADYEILSVWLNDIYPNDGLLISKHSHDEFSAVQFLQDGFDDALAQNMVANWGAYLPDQDLMVIIPTDSIPLITAADRDHLLVRTIVPQEAVVERVYHDIYLPGDAYLYQVICRWENNRWIITDMNLLPLDFMI